MAAASKRNVTSLDAAEAKQFRDTLNRIRLFIYREDEKTKASISLLLDQCISVDFYSFKDENVRSWVDSVRFCSHCSTLNDIDTPFVLIILVIVIRPSSD